MIEPMIKYSAVLYHLQYEDFLKGLQEQGMLHIQKKLGESDYREHAEYILFQKIAETKVFLKRLLSSRSDKDSFLNMQGKEGDVRAVLEEIEVLQERKQSLEALIKHQQKEREEARLFGSFSLEILKNLQERMSIRFFSVSSKYFTEEQIGDLPIFEISRIGNQVYFIALKNISNCSNSLDESSLLSSSQELNAPDFSLEKVQESIQESLDNLAKTDLALCETYAYTEFLDRAAAAAINKVEFYAVKEGADSLSEDKLRIVEGFLPKEKESLMDEFMEQQGVFYLKEAAEDLPEEEKIPVLLKNNAFTRLFEPITKIYSLPNYRELDLTPFFAPFFMMFFGFCLGDAGYGLLLIVLGFVLYKKVSVSMRPFLRLGQLFGLATMAFGTLSGSFFGIELVKLQVFSDIKEYFFDSNHMMTLSLCVGVVQILFGMFVKILNIRKRQGLKYAASEIGWLILLLSALPIVGAKVFDFHIGEIVSLLLYGIMALCLLPILFYNNPRKNVFINFGGGLWNTYNVVTGLVGDLLSYIRLFALGLTGSILGSVFNSLAIDMSGDIPVVSQLLMLFILLFGHSLNIALNMLGALVHPLRLTFVEFYKNAGFEGGGKAYTAFKKNN